MVELSIIRKDLISPGEKMIILVFFASFRAMTLHFMAKIGVVAHIPLNSSISTSGTSHSMGVTFDFQTSMITRVLMPI